MGQNLHQRTRIWALGATTAGLVVASALLSAPSVASLPPVSPAQTRPVTAPNAFYPVQGDRTTVRDLRTYSARHHGTDIAAPCGTPVVAVHAGTVRVATNDTWRGKYVVRVAVHAQGGLVTSTAYLSTITVKPGQIVAAGQQVGTVGARTRREGCRTYVSMNKDGYWRNPTRWLDDWVGQSVATVRAGLFDDPGFTIASFNVLGAGHTDNGGAYPPASVRTPKMVNLLESYKVTVAGLQEFEAPQKAQFLKLTDGTFGVFNYVSPRGWDDSVNAIVWRKSVWQFVSGDTYSVPYFYGRLRQMPVVLLRNRLTGREAYFMNTHNPADARGPAQQYRDQAVQIERKKIVELRQTGRAVFLTGDFNDTQEAFCPLTANMLSISPNSLPSMTCKFPSYSIDWIFGAGPTRFSWYLRDTSTKTDKISDHPIILARAHLQS